LGDGRQRRRRGRKRVGEHARDAGALLLRVRARGGGSRVRPLAVSKCSRYP